MYMYMGRFFFNDFPSALNCGTLSSGRQDKRINDTLCHIEDDGSDL